MDLREKHVLITGATSGIGRQLAVDLLARGSRVTSLDRREYTTDHHAWRSLKADVRDADAVRSCLEQIQEPIDVLFNNAGVMRRGELFDHSPEDFDLLVDTHIRGAWLVLKYALPLLRSDAVILQMASRHALGLPVNPALYGLTKRWVMDMMEVVSKTYPALTVKILCPGPVDTPLSKVGATEAEWLEKRKMMCTPEELSGHIVQLLESDNKSRLLFDVSSHTHFLE